MKRRNNSSGSDSDLFQGLRNLAMISVLGHQPLILYKQEKQLLHIKRQLCKRLLAFALYPHFIRHGNILLNVVIMGKNNYLQTSCCFHNWMFSEPAFILSG
jgi:hypothetical protein